MSELFNRFRKTVILHKMINPGDRILLSLSAGKDSMAMLDLMFRLKEELFFDAGIFHLNHLIRGEESDADEELVLKKAADYKMPLHCKKFNFINNRKPGISFEEHAREVRYSFLRELCADKNYNRIATAHNKTDNAETLLMRIFTGTGMQGLRGIRYKTENLIRPMLDFYPEEIYSYLKENNIMWREDRSNSDSCYLRNYVRNEIFPVIINRFPDAVENVVNLAGRADENESLLEFLSAQIYTEQTVDMGNGVFLHTEKCSGNISFIKYLLSRLLYTRFGISLNSSIYNEIFRKFVENRANIVLYSKDKLVIEKRFIESGTGIYISMSDADQDIPEEWEYQIDFLNSNKIYIKEIDKYIYYMKTDKEEFIKKKGEPGFVFMNIPVETAMVKIRNRRKGDRISLEKGVKKIKELMIEKKLDINTKKRVPLIVVDEEIAAYLPGAVNSHSDRVSCNFWITDFSQDLFLFYFTDF